MSNQHHGPMQWLKAEMHAHCNLDPVDWRSCAYSAEELIEEAARLGYRVLAITCHDLDIWTEEISAYADGLGITLIPGMEVSTQQGRHALVYNFRTSATKLDSLEKIRRLSRPDTLVAAPHPYFPSTKCLGRRIEQYMDVFDAIEISGFHARGIDFNRRACRIAAIYSKPLIGNSDAHQLWQLGRTFTWIQAEPNPESILRAVKQGRVRVESRELSYAQVAGWMTTSLFRSVFPYQKARDRQPYPFLQYPAAGKQVPKVAGWKWSARRSSHSR
jgi:predicted metal-dependent phosphoesterase TrpH